MRRFEVEREREEGGRLGRERERKGDRRTMGRRRRVKRGERRLCGDRYTMAASLRDETEEQVPLTAQSQKV